VNSTTRIAILAVAALAVFGCTKNTQQGIDSTVPATNSGDESVVGVRWMWVSTLTPVERIEVTEPENYTLRLLPDGRAEVRFDCNRGGGNYTIEGNALSLGPLASTRKACPDGSQDALFQRHLENVSSWFLMDDDLFLEMPMDSGTMRFKEAENN
jgi:heat shock protein HslJ